MVFLTSSVAGGYTLDVGKLSGVGLPHHYSEFSSKWTTPLVCVINSNPPAVRALVGHSHYRSASRCNGSPPSSWLIQSLLLRLSVNVQPVLLHLIPWALQWRPTRKHPDPCGWNSVWCLCALHYKLYSMYTCKPLPFLSVQRAEMSSHYTG